MDRVKRWANRSRDRVTDWYNENRRFGLVMLLGSTIAIFAFVLTDIAVNSNEILQSLIQADATILGFIGVTVTYMLTSYDTRLDRLSQQLFDCEGSVSTRDVHHSPRAQEISRRIERIREARKDVIGSIGFVVFFLILSLIFSLILLGSSNFDSMIITGLGWFSIAFFFYSILGIVAMFAQMSKTPEEEY